MRQNRNVPVSVPQEAQTDINLIHQPVTFAIQQYEGLALTSPEIQGLIRAETDSQLLTFFKHEASFFRGLGEVKDLSHEDLRKRLIWIESQIQGLEKRDITVNGKSYYNLIGDLQSQLQKQIVISNNYEPKLRQANKKIADLQKQIHDLRNTVIHQQNIKVQNQALKNAFRTISDVVRNPQRMRDIQRTVNDTLIPILDQYDVKFDAMLKSISSVGRATGDLKVKLKAHLNSFLKNIQRITKGTQQITLNGLESHIRSLLKDLQVSQTYQQYERNKLYKYQLQDLQAKFDNSIAVFRDSFQRQIIRNPALKNLIDISIFDTVYSETVQVNNYNGVIVLENAHWGGRLIEYKAAQDQRTIRMFEAILIQLRTLLKTFPQLRTSLRAEVVDIVETYVISDAVSIDQIQRIFQVIKYKTDVVKVENVYTYNSDAHLKTIFHLKVMIKALLQQLGKIKQKTQITLEIDENLIRMIEAQIIDFINPDDVLQIFKTVPKILEVQKIVEQNLTRYQGTLTQTKALQVQHAIYGQRIIERPVTLKQQVGIVHEVPVHIPVISQRAVTFQEQVAVQVPVIRQVVVDRIINTEVPIQVQIIQEKPFIQTEIVEIDRPIIQQVQKQIPIQIITQVPVVTKQIEKEIQIVDRYQQRLVDVVRQIQIVKEVKVVEQVPVQQIKYIQVEKIVNNFINVPQIVQITKQTIIPVTNTYQKPVNVIQTIEKIVQIVNVEQKLVEVIVEKNVPIIHQVPKPFREEVTHVIKGDKQEVILQVERIVEKPIIKQILQVKQVQVEKAVPLWMIQQKPVIIELKIPFIQNQVEIVTCEKEKIVPYREQVQLEVIREIPVPIVCEKEIIRPVRVIVQKIVEKMVEVPRVVEIQKIIEKIVVVPRVIQNIVQVPQIVQKIVQRQVQILKIVEIPVEVIRYLTKEVQQIIPEIVQRPVELVTIQQVEVEKPIYLNTEREVIKQIQVKQEIAVQVIREKEVHVVEEKIVERVLTVNNIEIKDRQVVIPFKQQVPIEVIREKAVEIKKIIETLVQVPQIIERNQVLYEIKNEVQIVEVIVQKPVDRIKEVIYTNVNNHIQYEPQIVNLTKQVLVIQTERMQIIKPEPYIVEKIVIQNNIHQEAVPVHLQTAVPCIKQVIVPVQVPTPVIIQRQVPRNVIRQKLIQVRTFVENNKQIEVQVEKVVQIETIRPQIVQITQQILKVVTEHEQRDVVQQVAIIEERNNIIQIPQAPIITSEIHEIYKENTTPYFEEKIIQRVTLLPQIVQVLKHIHEITDNNISGIGLGIAQFGVDVQVHTRDYIALCTNLRKQLNDMIATLRRDGSPQVRDNIQRLTVLLDDLIRFPNIVQIPRIIEKQVQVEKVVLVPTKDNDVLNREIASTALIEKLIQQIKRLKKASRLDLELDDDIKNIFFLELKQIERMENKLQQFSHVILNRFEALGNWTTRHSQMLNGFLQQRFLMAGIVKQSNDKISVLKRQLDVTEDNRRNLDNALTKLSIINVELKDSLQQIIQSLNNAVAQGQGRNQPQIQNLIVRARQTLNRYESNSLQESRFRYAVQDSEKTSKQVRRLEKQLESYRGGQSQRNGYLNTQIVNLRREVQKLTRDNQRIQTSSHESRHEFDQNRLIQQVENLKRTNITQRDEYDRNIRRLKEENQRQASITGPRVITSTITDRSEEEEKLREIQRGLDDKIISLTRELNDEVNSHNHSKLTITKLQYEIKQLRKRLQEANRASIVSTNVQGSEIEVQRSRAAADEMRRKYDELNLQYASNTTDLARSRREISQLTQDLQRAKDQNEKFKRLFNSNTSTVQGDERLRSPENRPGMQRSPQTPAHQLRGIQSPHTVGQQVREQDSQTSSSRITGGLSVSQTYRPVRSMTLRQLIGEKLDDTQVARIITLFVTRMQEQYRLGRRFLYSPDNIILQNYNPEAIDQIKIVFKDPINPKIISTSRKYLSPEVLQGAEVNQKSIIYNIALIWDELIHEQPFFKNEEQVLESADYRVRNARLNPIYKNALFEMLKKDPSKRIDFKDVLQRLAIQRFLK